MSIVNNWRIISLVIYTIAILELGTGFLNYGRNSLTFGRLLFHRHIAVNDEGNKVDGVFKSYVQDSLTVESVDAWLKEIHSMRTQINKMKDPNPLLKIYQSLLSSASLKPLDALQIANFKTVARDITDNLCELDEGVRMEPVVMALTDIHLEYINVFQQLIEKEKEKETSERPKDVYSVGGGDNMAKEIACYQFAGLIRTVYHNLINNLICYDEDAQVNSWEKPILMRIQQVLPLFNPYRLDEQLQLLSERALQRLLMNIRFEIKQPRPYLLSDMKATDISTKLSHTNNNNNRSTATAGDAAVTGRIYPVWELANGFLAIMRNILQVDEDDETGFETSKFREGLSMDGIFEGLVDKDYGLSMNGDTSTKNPFASCPAPSNLTTMDTVISPDLEKVLTEALTLKLMTRIATLAEPVEKVYYNFAKYSFIKRRKERSGIAIATTGTSSNSNSGSIIITTNSVATSRAKFEEKKMAELISAPFTLQPKYLSAVQSLLNVGHDSIAALFVLWQIQHNIIGTPDLAQFDGFMITDGLFTGEIDENEDDEEDPTRGFYANGGVEDFETAEKKMNMEFKDWLQKEKDDQWAEMRAKREAEQKEEMENQFVKYKLYPDKHNSRSSYNDNSPPIKYKLDYIAPVDFYCKEVLKQTAEIASSAVKARTTAAGGGINSDDSSSNNNNDDVDSKHSSESIIADSDEYDGLYSLSTTSTTQRRQSESGENLRHVMHKSALRMVRSLPSEMREASINEVNSLLIDMHNQEILEEALNYRHQIQAHQKQLQHHQQVRKLLGSKLVRYENANTFHRAGIGIKYSAVLQTSAVLAYAIRAGAHDQLRELELQYSESSVEDEMEDTLVDPNAAYSAVLETVVARSLTIPTAAYDSHTMYEQLLACLALQNMIRPNDAKFGQNEENYQRGLVIAMMQLLHRKEQEQAAKQQSSVISNTRSHFLASASRIALLSVRRFAANVGIDNNNNNNNNPAATATTTTTAATSSSIATVGDLTAMEVQARVYDIERGLIMIQNIEASKGRVIRRNVFQEVMDTLIMEGVSSSSSSSTSAATSVATVAGNARRNSGGSATTTATDRRVASIAAMAAGIRKVYQEYIDIATMLHIPVDEAAAYVLDICRERFDQCIMKELRQYSAQVSATAPYAAEIAHMAHSLASDRQASGSHRGNNREQDSAVEAQLSEFALLTRSLVLPMSTSSSSSSTGGIWSGLIELGTMLEEQILVNLASAARMTPVQATTRTVDIIVRLLKAKLKDALRFYTERKEKASSYRKSNNNTSSKVVQELSDLQAMTEAKLFEAYMMYKHPLIMKLQINRNTNTNSSSSHSQVGTTTATKDGTAAATDTDTTVIDLKELGIKHVIREILQLSTTVPSSSTSSSTVSSLSASTQTIMELIRMVEAVRKLVNDRITYVAKTAAGDSYPVMNSMLRRNNFIGMRSNNRGNSNKRKQEEDEDDEEYTNRKNSDLAAVEDFLIKADKEIWGEKEKEEDSSSDFQASDYGGRIRRMARDSRRNENAEEDDEDEEEEEEEVDRRRRSRASAAAASSQRNRRRNKDDDEFQQELDKMKTEVDEYERKKREEEGDDEDSGPDYFSERMENAENFDKDDADYERDHKRTMEFLNNGYIEGEKEEEYPVDDSYATNDDDEEEEGEEEGYDDDEEDEEPELSKSELKKTIMEELSGGVMSEEDCDNSDDDDVDADVVDATLAVDLKNNARARIKSPYITEDSDEDLSEITAELEDNNNNVAEPNKGWVISQIRADDDDNDRMPLSLSDQRNSDDATDGTNNEKKYTAKDLDMDRDFLQFLEFIQVKLMKEFTLPR